MKKVFLIINVRSFFISLAAVTSTWFCLKFQIIADFPLTLIATAIVFPIVFSINGAYQRREKALEEYSQIKANAQSFFFAVRDWIEHSEDEGKANIDHCKTLIADMLFSCRKLFSSEIEKLRDNEADVYQSFSHLSLFVKLKLRAGGLAPPEVSRAHHFLNQIYISFENAKHIYQYRTPRSLRMFSSIFITVLPILYGPYFAFQAADYSAEVAYIMPILFALVLVGLSNIQGHLENPYDGVGEDDISLNVEQFIQRLDLQS